MKCWNCGEKLPDPPWGKLSFRETCDKCHASLHCCCNCVHHRPSLANQCAIPGTDCITDRGAANFCEDFKLLGKGPVIKGDPNEAAKRLFGEEDKDSKKQDPKKRFDSLFGD